jgi:hypothetical protein
LLCAALSMSIIACGGKATSKTDDVGTKLCSPATDPTIKIGYEAVTTDGHYLVVTGEHGSERVFYGTPDHMSERRVTGTSDSCAHQIDFEVAETPYVAVLSTCPGSIPSRLIIGTSTGGAASMSLPLTVLLAGRAQSDADAGAAALSPADLSYFCF